MSGFRLCKQVRRQIDARIVQMPGSDTFEPAFEIREAATHIQHRIPVPDTDAGQHLEADLLNLATAPIQGIRVIAMP